MSMANAKLALVLPRLTLRNCDLILLHLFAVAPFAVDPPKKLPALRSSMRHDTLLVLLLRQQQQQLAAPPQEAIVHVSVRATVQYGVAWRSIVY